MSAFFGVDIVDAMSIGCNDELDALCRSLFDARSLASSKAAAAVAGLFVLVTELAGVSET